MAGQKREEKDARKTGKVDRGLLLLILFAAATAALVILGTMDEATRYRLIGM